MSSSTTPDSIALRFKNISKTYMLYGSQRDQLVWILGLNRLGVSFKTPPKAFSALKDIDLEVPRGHRIGIIGRNGAGKTTLLKLICGNFAPSTGSIEVNGTVQALMSSGLGFHPEYTGRENVLASLQYNGIPYEDYDKELEDILDFCELGEFIDQPFKSYSLGMQARLMFAATTAIKPDILIVDEVLGAGDAYFVAKCKKRVEKLINTGCTMLLVSHSMPQVLELCKEAIWLDKGQIKMKGDSFAVVKAYEEYLHGPACKLKISLSTRHAKDSEPKSGDGKSQATAPQACDSSWSFEKLNFQEPLFVPHAQPPEFPEIPPPTGLKYVTTGGVSQWDSVPGLKFVGFTIVSEKGETSTLCSMRPAKAMFSVTSEHDGDFNCRYAFTVYDHMGRTAINMLSPEDSFHCEKGELHSASLVFNPLQLGPGDYVVSISLHMYSDIAIINSAPRYDLLSRSFTFKVEIPDSLHSLPAQFYHSGEWRFQGACKLPEPQSQPAKP